MEYRLGVPEDLDEICVLINKAIILMESQGIHQWDDIYPSYIDFKEDIMKNTLYVAYEKDHLIAVYVISQECDEEYSKCTWSGSDDKACIIHRLCISPDYQNRGVGTKILQHIENQLSQTGYESARLDVFSQNPYALKLYTRNGYKERGYADWRKGRFILMEKNL